jgi:hypothetical protein
MGVPRRMPMKEGSLEPELPEDEKKGGKVQGEVS